jgi:hypothetical protein
VKPSSDTQQNFDQQLRQLLRRTRLRVLVQGVVPCLGIGGLMAMAAMWAVGGAIGPAGFNGWGLSLSLAAGLLALIWRMLIVPWRSLRTPAQLAVRIEAAADFNNHVVAAEEAGRRSDRWPDDLPVVAELKRRLLSRAAKVLPLVTPLDLVRRRHERFSWLVFGSALAVGAALFLTVPDEMEVGLGRLVEPSSGILTAPTGGLYADRGIRQVVAGKDVDLVGLDFGSGFEQAVAEIKIGRGTWQTVPTRSGVVLETPVGYPDLYNRWEAAALTVHEDFSWRFRRGERVSEVRTVEIKHHPLLTQLSGEIIPPKYTRLPRRTLERLPAWIEVPAGSRLVLKGLINHRVVEANLVANGDTVSLTNEGLQIGGQLDVATDQEFTISLLDDFGLSNGSPLRYEVAAALDAVPGVSLSRPGDDGVLPIAGEFVLLAEAADDFGLSSLSLMVSTGKTIASDDERSDRWTRVIFWRHDVEQDEAGEQWQEVATSAGKLRLKVQPLETYASGLRARMRLTLLADDLDLVAGDALELMVEAVDNKEPAPAGKSRSAVLRLQLPSAGDVLTTQAEANSERMSELEAMRQRSRTLNVDLDRLTRELMKNPTPDWTRQQEMEAAITRQQKLQQELGRVAEQLQAELNKMAQSQLASEAQLQKADEMNELLNQNNSDQLGKLLEKMQDGSSQASPEEVAQAMKEVAKNQADMARRLDAALAMLKRMAQQQELEGLTALLEKMIQKQQELADLSRALEAQQESEAEGDEETAGSEDEGAESDSAESEDGGSESDSADAEGEPSESQDASSENPESSSDSAENESGESSEQDSDAEPKTGSEEQSGEQDGGESPSEPSAEELARRQEALEEELAQLQEKLEEALENLREENAANPRESNEEMADAMEKALEQVEQQQEKDSMGKASEQLEQMDPSEAAKMQEQALRDLGSLYSVLLESQQAMEQAMKMEQVGSLRGFAADMLALSAKQEEISQMIPAQLRDVQSLQLTRNQHRVQRAAGQVRLGVGELMAESPNRMMKIMGQLDDLIEAMGTSVQAMEDNRAPIARRQARESLSQTNRIVIGLLTEAQMQGQSGGSGQSSPSSASEKLQEMAQEQAKLNGVTEELRQMLANRGKSQKSRSEMRRLGSQQAEMAQRMGEIADEQAERKEGDRLLGDLGQMGRDMESIGQDIEEGLVSEETLIRQERILSRMLDARNSARRRDYNNRRESNSSDEVYADQRGGGLESDSENENSFRLRYHPLEQAPMEYRDLVRRYFTALDSLSRDTRAIETPGDQP